MRIVNILFCIILSAISFGQSNIDQKIQEAYVRNHIKNKESWDYKYEGDKLSKLGNKTSLTTFTRKGEVSEVITYNPKGYIIHVENYKYDRNGNRTEYTRVSGENADKPAYQKLSKYNNSGKLTEESGFDGVENFRNVYSYNPSGELSEIRYYTTNNIIKEKRIFSTQNNVTTVMIYNASGNLTSKLVMRYDDNGNLIEESVYGINQDELEKKLFDYDENQKLKEEAKYRMDKIMLTTTYNYNNNGDLLEIYEEVPGSGKFLKRDFLYDSDGNLVEIKWRRKETDLYNRMTYTYDKNGICSTLDTYYPDTDYRVLTKYSYARY